MGLPNFCYHLAIKEMAINDKIRLVSLVVYNYILPRKTGKCNTLIVIFIATASGLDYRLYPNTSHIHPHMCG